MTTLARGALAAAFAAVIGADARAQTRPTDLALMSLEDLMKIEVTSASRKEQRADEVPAAIYVITQEDIRRSGLTTVPELLRLVPGVQVAQVNSNKWAVSVRGSNDLFSNKLLVMIDGRSVYNPLFSSALWDTEDILLEDVDRIEVIRGPGASIWGANAVNGVINILTMTAADTQGLLVRAGGGTFDRADAAVRYGGRMGSATYRVYSQWSDHGDSRLPPGTETGDHWHSVTSGFRADWAAGPNAMTVQSSVTSGQSRALWTDLTFGPPSLNHVILSGVSETAAGTLVGRWTHTRQNGASLQVQSFLDIAHRQEPIGQYDRHTIDFDATYHSTLGKSHDLVVGGGYRFIDEQFAAGPHISLTLAPGVAIVNAFAQDELAMAGGRVRLTLGTKFEHDSSSGANVQPTARVMWDAAPRQHVWAKTSRAVRTPSLLDRGIRTTFSSDTIINGLPLVTGSLGNPALQSETFVDAESGYRLDLGAVATIDVTGFVGRYHGLVTQEPFAPRFELTPGAPHLFAGVQNQNTLDADTHGVEIAGRWRVMTGWQLDGSYSGYHLTAHPDPSSLDHAAAAFDGNAPSHQWRLHSAMSLGRRAQGDVSVQHVGPLGTLAIPGYSRADARIAWPLTRQLWAALAGQNLLSADHAEFTGTGSSIQATRIPRSVSLRMTWKF
jgi:iron complex outermembrane receptor protein